MTSSFSSTWAPSHEIFSLLGLISYALEMTNSSFSFKSQLKKALAQKAFPDHHIWSWSSLFSNIAPYSFCLIYAILKLCIIFLLVYLPFSPLLYKFSECRVIALLFTTIYLAEDLAHSRCSKIFDKRMNGGNIFRVHLDLLSLISSSLGGPCLQVISSSSFPH